MLSRLKFIVIFVLVFCSENGFAQDVNHVETIETSLTSLKTSAKHAAFQNDRFYEKNQSLMKKIQFLKLKMISLEEQKDELFSVQAVAAPDVEKEKKRADFLEEGLNNSVAQIDQAQREQSRLHQRLDMKEKQKEVIGDDIVSTRAEIFVLMKRLEEMKRESSASPRVKKKEQLMRMMRETETEIESLEVQFAKYEQQGLQSALAVEQLKKENDRLVLEIKVLIREIKTLEARERQAQEGLSRVIQDNDGQLKILSKEIKRLKERRAEIENVFNQAREKIQAQNVNLAHVDIKESQIEDNVKIIRKENAALKKEIKSLEKVLSEVED